MSTTNQAKKRKTAHRAARRIDPKHAHGARQRAIGAPPIATAQSKLGVGRFNTLSLTFKPLTGMDMIMRTSAGQLIASKAGQLEFLQKFIGSFPQADRPVRPTIPVHQLVEQTVNKYTRTVKGATVILRDGIYMVNIQRNCGPDGAWHLPLHWLPLLKEVSPALYELVFWGLIWLQQKGVQPLARLCKHDYLYQDGLLDVKHPDNEWGPADSQSGALQPAVEYRKKWEVAKNLYATGPAAQLAKHMNKCASRKQWIHAYDIWFAIPANKHNGLEQSFYILLKKLRVLFDQKDRMADYYLLSEEDREAMVMDDEHWCTPMDQFWFNWHDSEDDLMSETLNEHLNDRYSDYGSIMASVSAEVELGKQLPDLNNKQLPDLIHKFFQEAYNVQDAWFEYDATTLKTTLKHELSYNYGKLINIL